jgi:repressor LexA
VLNCPTNEDISLTKRQKQVYQYILRFRAKHGYAPSIAEMAERFEVCPNTIAGHLKALEKKGHINIAPRIARGITVNE